MTGHPLGLLNGVFATSCKFGSVPIATTASPAGNRIPVHCHETEEIFFILEGECLVRCWEGEQSCGIRLARRDLVALPPFLNHEIFNDSPGDCHVQTLLAKPQPLRPQYADPELLKLQAAAG